MGGSGSGQPPRKTHRRTNSLIMSESAANSLLAEICPEQISPKPVGVNTETGLVVGENQFGGNKRTAGVKRRAGKDIAPPSRHTRSVSLSTCFEGEKSVPVEPYDLFTEYELEQIVDSEKLTELAQKDPRVVKRLARFA